MINSLKILPSAAIDEKNLEVMFMRTRKFTLRPSIGILAVCLAISVTGVVAQLATVGLTNKYDFLGIVFLAALAASLELNPRNILEEVRLCQMPSLEVWARWGA